MNDNQEPPQESGRRDPIVNENEGLGVDRPVGTDTDLLRSLTRLVLGGFLEGWDQFSSRLQGWEEEAASGAEGQGRERSLIIIDNDLEGTEVRPRPPVETSEKVVRLALTGLLFKAEARMAKRRNRVLQLANQTTASLMGQRARGVGEGKRFRSARKRFNSLVRRGEAVSREWIELGRIEDARSRQLVRTAAQDSFSDTMDELGQAPALQDLVCKQSAGLTQEALDEARVRTVTGDYALEHFLRSLLRRVPRSQLPSSPSTADWPGEAGDVRE